MEHTPTPWRYQGELSDGRVTQHIYTASGRYGHPASCGKEEDAAFIVRAVNCHEELIQALLNAHGIIDNANPNDHDGALYCQCETALAYQKAFAKAEGK